MKIFQHRMKIIISLTTIIFISLTFVGLYRGFGQQKAYAAIFADQEGWVNYKDPHGFSVYIPKNWNVKVSDSGVVKIGPHLDLLQEPVVFAWTIMFPAEKKQEEVLQAILPELQNSFPNLKIISERFLGKYQSLILQVEYSERGVECVGAILVSAKGKNVFISGLGHGKGKFSRDRPHLLKVLSSFKYDSSLQDPSKITSSIQMVPWRDPNEGAFTISIPKGWGVYGGLVRPYIDAGIKIIVTYGDRGIHIENPFPPFYITPNWTLNMSGFVEGSRYNLAPGLAQDMVVMRERNAFDYIQGMLSPHLKLNLKDIRLRPDIASRFIKTPGTAQTTAAEATLFGDGKIHKIIVVEQSMYAAETGLWSVSLVHYWAPIDELSGTEDIVGAMASSFQIDPMWLKREEIEVAKRVGFINKAGSEVADIIHSVFDYQCRIQDRASRQWSDAMLGVKKVYNPRTGEGYDVPSEAAHYWSDGYNVVGTKTYEPPTYHDDWTELLPAEQ